MPEIKNYSQWSADNALDKDPIDALREYTDYARMQYLRSGVPMNTVEPELRAGIEDKLKADGLLSEETTPEQLNELQTRLFAPKANLDFDAAVVQNYLALDDPDSGDEETKNNSSLLRDYLAKKKYSAELAAPLEGAVKDLLQDSALVRRARVAAVDRGEYNAIAVTEDDGTRNVYAGSRDLEDSEIPMVAESLVRSGALDTSDIVGLQDNYRKVFGGKSTLNQNARSAMFNDALDSLSKTDPEIADILSGASAAAAKQESAARDGLGGKAAAFATGSLAAPFVGLGEAVGAAMGLEQPKPTGAEIAEYQFRQGDSTAAEMIRQKLLENPAMRKRFSEQEISAFTNDRVLSQTDYKFDNTKPESGLRQLSTGEVNIAPALLASPQKLEDALGKASLNEEQKEFARKQRAALLDVRVPQMLKLIASSSDEAVSAYATAKQNGVGDREFVEQWLSNEGNYSSFGNRAASFGLSALRAIGEVPLGIAALAGSETATNIMLRSQAKQSRYAEYGALFGDEFGLAQEALNTLPAVAVDIALTIGTAGVGRAASAAARAGSMSARTLAKGAVGVLDDAALAAVRGASAGAAAETSAALRAAGRSWISKAATTAVEQTIPVALPAFTRSASSTYVSIYGSLPEDMTHEEKHKQAIGFALAAGVGTAAITAGLSALGAGGVEKLGVRTAAKGLDDLTYREAKVLFESVKNEGKAVSDKAFRGALAAEVGGNYKRLIGSTAAGFRDEAFEEALDQSINMAIEDAALKKNRPLAEKLQQVWNAGLIGGVLGGGLNLASQALAPTASAQTKALQQRTAVLDGIAKRLSTSNAPETAASVQRMMDAANAAAVASAKKDAAAAAAQTAAAPTTAVRTVAEQLEFKFDDPRGVPPADTRLADLIGERVYIGDTGINGIAEIDTNTGEVVINFSKPTKVKGKPNVTRYVLGTKFQKATGVTLKPKIKTLTKPVGGLPAGTRIFNTNKLDYVLPSLEAVNKARTEGKPLLVLQRDEKQRVIGVTLRGVALVKSPTTTTDTTITDPDLMREVLRLYPEPAPAPETGEQLELGFGAAVAAPTATATPTATAAPTPQVAPKTGWAAQWELATRAKAQGVDLTKLTREEYADFAISEGLAIDDSQLRMATSLRAATSMAEYQALRKTQIANTPDQKKADRAFAKFTADQMNLAEARSNGTSTGDVAKGVTIRSGTKDSNSWLYWKINTGASQSGVTHKAYAGFSDVYKSLTPARMKAFLIHLQSKGYNGDVKSIQDLSNQSSISDQIVMHGATEADAQLALRESKAFFGSELNFTDVGLDQGGKSHSQIISDRIKATIAKNQQSTPTPTPAAKPAAKKAAKVAPAPQAEPTPTAPEPTPEPELQALLEDTDQLEIDFEAEAPESTKTNLNALSVILAGDPVLNFLRSTDPKRKGFAASVQQISDGGWAAAGDALDAANDFIADLGDSEPLLTKAALDTLGPILFKYDTGTTIRKRAAAESARRNQGKTPAGPAPTAAAEAPAPVTPTPEAPAPVTPTPEAPAPAPAAKKAARKAAKAEPTKEQVLDDVAQALVKLEQALLKERKLGSRQLGDRKIAREISEKLTGLGYAPADTPEGFFLNVVDAGDPSAFERLVGAFQWASGQPVPVAEAAAEPAAELEPEDLLERVEALIADEGRRKVLIGKVVQLRLYPESSTRTDTEPLEIVGFDDGDILAVDPGTNKSKALPYPLGEFVPESFTPYLEAGAVEAVAEPAAEPLTSDQVEEWLSDIDNAESLIGKEITIQLVTYDESDTRRVVPTRVKITGVSPTFGIAYQNPETDGIVFLGDEHTFDPESFRPYMDLGVPANMRKPRSLKSWLQSLENSDSEAPQAEAYLKKKESLKLFKLSQSSTKTDQIGGSHLFKTPDGELIVADKDGNDWDLRSAYDSEVTTTDEGAIDNKDALQRLSEELAEKRRQKFEEAVAKLGDTRNYPEVQALLNAGDVVSQYRLIDYADTLDQQAGTLSMLAPKGDNILYMLAGQSANMPQFMRDSLETAKAMAAAGKTREEIRAATGWFPGDYDGKMRWEIPDNQATVIPTEEFNQRATAAYGGPVFTNLSLKSALDRIRAGTVLRLGDVLKHDALFSAYPALADLPFFPIGGNISSGSFRVLDGEPMMTATVTLSDGRVSDETLSTILHEVQHWIQKEEGFARGGSTNNLITQSDLADANKFREARIALLRYEKSLQSYVDSLAEEQAKKRGFLGRGGPDAKRVASLESSISEVQKSVNEIWVAQKIALNIDKGSTRASLLSAINAVDVELGSSWVVSNRNKGLDMLYRLLAGEIEARDVQSRRTMTAEQRAATKPYSSENIAPDQAIVMFGTGDQSSILAPQGDNTLRQNIADIPAALQGMLPAGFTLQADPNMDGALGYNAVTDPTVVRYNPNLVGDLTIGLARADALATLRTAVDHELGHAAAEAEFGQDSYAALATELGEDMLTNIASIYYSLVEPDFNLRAERIKADRASGALPDWKIAAEWVRMEIERIANGRTSEQRMLFLRSRPSLLAKFIDALGAFVVRLRARFFEQPTTGTAASISNAARQLRKMRNGGYLPAAPKADLNYGGHAAELIGAIERGSDQTLFTMPIGAATAAGKAQVEGLWTRIGKKFQNLPPYLRDNKEERDGIMALGNNIILNFNKRFSKLTKENPAIPIDDIRTVLGRTDPTLDNAALALIQTELDAFAGRLPFDMDTVLAEEMIDKERDRLQQRERLASNDAFRKEQQSAEQRIRNAGAPALADLLVKFRTDIDNMSARFTDLSPVIDENMGVYLTRTYRFHNTEGWALLAAGGIQPDGSQLGMFRGKEIDFAKLRDNAARTYEQDALAKAAKDGVVLTAEQLRDRTHEMLDKYLAKLQGSAESSPSPSQDSLQKDLTKLMPKGNINKELMELLGVVEDPLENAVRTMVAVTKIAANNTFLRSTYDTLLSMNLASTKQTPEMGVKALRADKDGSLSPLSDLFTTPEIANALQAEWGVNARNAERNTDSVMREGGRALMAVASFATTSKTLFSFGFYPRNAVSGQGLLLSAQGILPINRYTKEAYRLARRAYFESAKRTPEQDAMIQRLIELQVLADDTQGRVAMDIMRGFVTDNEQDLDALLRDFQEATEGKPKKLLDRIGSSAAGKTYGKTVDVLASLNNWFDGAVKTQAYMYELDVLKKDNAAALAKDPTLLAGLELRAADKVKMTMPSHSRQLPIVKSLNQTSVGMVFFPFARWKTEVFRTMYNTPRLALKEIREGGPAEKARGWKRLTGFTGTLAFGGSAVGTAYAAIFRFIGGLLGEDEEKKDTRELNNDELYALRESLPVWQRGHALHTRLVGGQVQVIDMTAITPYAQLTDLFVITHEGIVNKESDWNAKRTAGYVAQQLIGTQIAATALNEVLNNSDDFGQPVYRDTDNPVEVTGKILAHFGGSALKPAAVDQVMRATRGGEQDRWEIITGELIGARPRNHKMSEIEYRAFRGVKKMLDDSAQIKASLVTGRKIDDDEVVKTLEDHQESLNRTQRKLAKVMQGLQSMGSTRGGIYGSGKNAGFSAQRLALAEKGDNLRWVPNQDWLKGVYQNMTRTGEDDPMNRINLIRRTLSGMPATYGVLE